MRVIYQLSKINRPRRALTRKERGRRVGSWKMSSKAMKYLLFTKRRDLLFPLLRSIFIFVVLCNFSFRLFYSSSPPCECDNSSKCYSLASVRRGRVGCSVPPFCWCNLIRLTYLYSVFVENSVTYQSTPIERGGATHIQRWKARRWWITGRDT